MKRKKISLQTFRFTFTVFGLACLFIVLQHQPTFAQSTLFNIPSTDVVAKKKTYVEFDFVSHPESHQNGGFQTHVPRVVFGIGRQVEVGVNASFTDALIPDQPVELQPNAKWQFYADEQKGLAAAAGTALYLPVAHRAGTDTFAMLYSTASKKVTAARGARITGGAYALLGRATGTGTKMGAIAGYEQPVHRKLSFVADWFSGKNRFGYATPGLSVAVSSRSLFYAGYSIGNQGRKNNALFLYYGITF